MARGRNVSNIVINIRTVQRYIEMSLATSDALTIIFSVELTC